MNTSVIGIARRSSTTRTAWTSKPALLRSSLVVVCLAAIAIAVCSGAPSTLPHDDPELARLLRGMASIKAAIAVAAMALSWWRFGRPVPHVVAATYVVGTGLMTGATVAIWQLSSLLPGAALFHVGLFAMSFVALRSDGMGRSPLRR